MIHEVLSIHPTLTAPLFSGLTQSAIANEHTSQNLF